MQQSPSDSHLTERRRRWALRAALIAAPIAVCVLIAVGSGSFPSVFGAHAASPTSDERGVAGTFRLTDAQLRSIGSASVANLEFRSEAIADGKIAFNADTLAPVYSPYSGRVTRIIAPLGAQVKQGQPLFQLDASEYAQAASDLLAAAAQATLNVASEQRKRAQYAAHALSLQEWQQSQSDLAASQATLAAVRNRLRILGKSEAEIDAIAEHPQPDADATVVAPIGGVVIDRQIGPGQYLQAAATIPVYTIADLSSVWLVAYVREGDASAVRVGQSVRVHVLALPDREFSARLSYVGAAVDPASRRVPVHAVIDNRDGILKPEMFASFTIATSAETMAPSVPQAAVIYEGDQARVWVMQTDHALVLHEVRLGRTLGDNIEVLQGLTAGERVVTRGALFIDRAASGS